jgi:hypothetical protein
MVKKPAGNSVGSAPAFEFGRSDAEFVLGDAGNQPGHGAHGVRN